MKQSTAVIEVTKAVFAKSGRHFEKGMRAKEHVTDAMFEEIRAELIKGFENGTIDLSSPQKDLSNYVGGLINNCFTKSRELNGDVNYVPTFKRHSDPRLKALHALKQQFRLDEERSKLIDAQIAEIETEIQAKRKSTVKPVDLSVLDADFLQKLA